LGTKQKKELTELITISKAIICLLQQARPKILGKNTSDFVFPTRTGKAVEITYFERMLREWDQRLRGTPREQTISPHRIRDMVSHTCIATKCRRSD
jgi:site-specific recombinase XerD